MLHVQQIIKLDLVDVQEVMWDKGGTVKQGIIIFYGHFGDLGRRWKDNFKMDFQELGCGGMELIDLAQDRDRLWALVNSVTNLGVP
jgi:hypothetical protein